MWQFSPWKLEEKKAPDPPPPDKFADAKKTIEEEELGFDSEKDIETVQNIFDAFNSKNWDINSEAANAADIADKLSKLDDNVFNLCEAILKQNYMIMRQNNAIISRNDALKEQNKTLIRKVEELSERLETLERLIDN